MVLALSEMLSVAMWAINLGFSTVISVVLYRVSATTKKYERAEDGHKKELGEVRGELHSTATKLIDERFRAMSHELNGHVQGFVSALDEMKVTVRDRDGDLRGLGERDHKLELEVLAKLHEIKTYVVEKAASKEDLKAHEHSMNTKVERITERLGESNQRLAVIEQKVERTGAGRRSV